MRAALTFFCIAMAFSTAQARDRDLILAGTVCTLTVQEKHNGDVWVEKDSALSPNTDTAIFEGKIQTDRGLYSAEVRVAEGVRRSPGRYGAVITFIPKSNVLYGIFSKTVALGVISIAESEDTYSEDVRYYSDNQESDRAAFNSNNARLFCTRK